MPRKQKFRTGDIVFSPKENCDITVREYKDGYVVCNWFTKDENGNYQLHEEPFDESLLFTNFAKID